MPCPLHADSRPSLLVASRIGKVRCAAGCLDGRWRSPAAFVVAMGIPPEEAGRLLGGLPETAVQASRAAMSRAPWAEPASTALRRVLSYLFDRRCIRERVVGQAEDSLRMAAWAKERALDLPRVRDWVVDLDTACRSALEARFPRETLRLAGLMEERGRWLFDDHWPLLLVCRDRDGSPVWCQGVARTAWAREKAKYRSPLGVPPAPFGLDTVSGKETVVLTEGIVDALSVLGSGIVPGPRGGWHLSVGRVGVLGVPGVAIWDPSWLDCLDQGQEVWVATDPDPAGEDAARRLIDELSRRGIRARRWRPEEGDLNDVVRSLMALRRYRSGVATKAAPATPAP